MPAGKRLNTIPDPDAELVFKAAAGDRRAFALLLHRNYDRMFRVIWRIVGSKTDADDIIQDVCLALVTKIGTFRGESKVSTWLTTIAVNAARDYLRRRKSRARTVDGYATVVSLFP